MFYVIKFECHLSEIVSVHEHKWPAIQEAKDNNAFLRPEDETWYYVVTAGTREEVAAYLDRDENFWRKEDYPPVAWEGVDFTDMDITTQPW